MSFHPAQHAVCDARGSGLKGPAAVVRVGDLRHSTAGMPGSWCGLGAILAVVAALSLRAEEGGTAKVAPVLSQDLEYFAPLWKQSLFTSVQHAAPAPTASFTDQLSLAGLYEVDGKSVAVIIDKTTSQVSEVESNAGVGSKRCLLKVETGATPNQARVLLQIGTQIGWLTFSDGDAAPRTGGGVQTAGASNASGGMDKIGILPSDSGTSGEPALSVPDIRTEVPKPVPTSEDSPMPPR